MKFDKIYAIPNGLRKCLMPTEVFCVFSGGIEVENWLKIVKKNPPEKKITVQESI